MSRNNLVEQLFKLRFNKKNYSFKIGLPEGDDPRMSHAALAIAALPEVSLVRLWGVKDDLKIMKVDKKILKKISFPAASQVDVQKILRQHLEKKLASKEGFTSSSFDAFLENPLYLALQEWKSGSLDSCVAGVSQSTAHVTRAALHVLGLAGGEKKLSSSFLMLKLGAPPLLFADCAVQVEPTVEELVDIARNSVRTWQALFGSQKLPRVAFLSFSTLGSAIHSRVETVAKASIVFQKKYPDIPSGGEMQVDTALVPEVAARKIAGSSVEGKADILIFPQLDAGNISYKLVERLGGYQAIGPIFQGLSKPFLDLSRGCSFEDIVAAVKISLILNPDL